MEVKKETIPQDLLKKYLIYCKRFIHPKLSEIDQNKVTQFYADIRRESNIAGGIPIAVRHIESVIRMSESFAKIHLRNYVTSDDIDNAIQMLLESFLQSQKTAIARQLRKKFEKYQKSSQDTSQLLLHTLKNCVKDRAIYQKALEGLQDEDRVFVKVPQDNFEHEAREFNRHNLMDFYQNPIFQRHYKIEGKDIITL